MNDRKLDRDIELLSAYIDAQLPTAEDAKVKARLESDPQFKQLLKELSYTRSLLQALPQKRAPRNFTLSSEYAPRPRRSFWLQPALSFVSISAAVMLVVVFTSTFLLNGARSAAPAAELMAMESSSEANTSVIINWNPIQGMGGGAADSYAGGYGGGGAGGPGWDLTAPAASSEPLPTEAPAEGLPAEAAPLPEPTMVEGEAPLTAMAEPAPETSAKVIGEADPSTMILGLPADEIQGEVIETASDQAREALRTGKSIPANVLMVVSSLIAVMAGAAAILLRRR